MSLLTKFNILAVRLTIQISTEKSYRSQNILQKPKKRKSKKYHNSQQIATKLKKYHNKQKLPQQCNKTQNIPQNSKKIPS